LGWWNTNCICIQMPYSNLLNSFTEASSDKENGDIPVCRLRLSHYTASCHNYKQHFIQKYSNTATFSDKNKVMSFCYDRIVNKNDTRMSLHFVICVDRQMGCVCCRVPKAGDPSNGPRSSQTTNHVAHTSSVVNPGDVTFSSAAATKPPPPAVPPKKREYLLGRFQIVLFVSLLIILHFFQWLFWHTGSGNDVHHINEVTLRQARLVLD